MRTASILIYGYLRETQTIIKAQIHLDIAKIIIDYYWFDPFKHAEPIKCQSILQLKQFTELGADIDGIKYNATMESDRCIVIRGENKVIVVATCVHNNVATTLNVCMDSAIMNPSSNVLGLRLDHRLQVYNLDMHTRMKATESEDAVLYWTWLDSRTIAFITTKGIYHWVMDELIPPEKIIDLESKDNLTEITNYDCSKDGKWLLLQKIETTHIETIYSMQLNNIDPTTMNTYQSMNNIHATCFAYVNINDRDATIFCLSKRYSSDTTTFNFIEVGAVTNPLRVQHQISFEHVNDFIIRMVPSSKYGCMYSISSKGTLFLNDIQSAALIFKRSISQTTMLLAIPHRETGGIQTLDSNGCVELFHVDEHNYVPYIINNINAKLGVAIATQYNLPSCIDGSNNIFKTRVEQLVAEAALLYPNVSRDVLRTYVLKHGNKFEHFVSENGVGFYEQLLDVGPLNKAQSVEFCQLLLELKSEEGKTKIEKLLKDRKLECSEELGDLLDYDDKVAGSVFYRAEVPGKAILCFIRLGRGNTIVRYCETVNYNPNWKSLLCDVQRLKREYAIEFANELMSENYLSVQDVVDALLDPSTNDFEMTAEFLWGYLHNTDSKSIKINLSALPKVIGVILDANEDYFMIGICINDVWLRELIYEYVFGTKTVKYYIVELIDMVNAETYSVDELMQEFKNRNFWKLSSPWLNQYV